MAWELDVAAEAVPPAVCRAHTAGQVEIEACRFLTKPCLIMYLPEAVCTPTSNLYCSTEYKYCTTTHFALSCSCSVCTSVTQGTAPTPALNGHETRGGGVMRTSRGLWRASRTFRGLYALCRIARYPRIDAAVGPSPRDDGRSAVAGLLARRSDRRSRRRRWTLSSALDVGRGRVES